uniref:Uncharacterized protein n=2 Tax=Enterobacteriaceae TaxID=543 RepID=A0A2R4KLQ6_ECOLX|nr:hypothetical protein pCf587_0138 [Citrobacter freundii]AVV60540.1 Hypothetical protein [Escherichia coli]
MGCNFISIPQVKLATSIRQNHWRGGEGRLIRAYHLSGDAK